jgi:hypothetical protein
MGSLSNVESVHMSQANFDKDMLIRANQQRFADNVDDHPPPG